MVKDKRLDWFIANIHKMSETGVLFPPILAALSYYGCTSFLGAPSVGDLNEADKSAMLTNSAGLKRSALAIVMSSALPVLCYVAAAALGLGLVVHLMMPPKKGERSNAAVLYYHIGIRLNYIWQGAWFRYWTEAPVSGLKDRLIPPLDWFTMFLFKITWTVKGQLFSGPPALTLLIWTFSGAGFFCNLLFSWAESRTIIFYEMAGVKRTKNTVIEEYDWQNGTPEDFYQEYVVKNPRPVVLRRFSKSPESLQKWKFESLMERFGDEQVYLTQSDKDGYLGKLREVEDPKVYLHNSETLFLKDPSLMESMKLGRLKDYIGKGLGYCQLFMGKCGTGTPFHNAAVWNFFTMLDGKKTWYFVSPEHTHLLYPFITAGRAAGFSNILYPDECDYVAHPMFKFCPVYETTLEAGDVMLNPAWWWHAIRNITRTSVAVASRWHGDGTVGRGFMMTDDNYDILRMSSFNFFTGLGSWIMLHQILRTPSPQFDEHTSLRERNNRFTDVQRLLAKHKWKY
jgi:hypothetical protein